MKTKKDYEFNLAVHDCEYDVFAYLLNSYKGIMDRLQTSDFDEVKNFVHENAMAGSYIEIHKYDLTNDNGYELRIDPNRYIEEFEKYGDYYYEFK